MSTKIAYKCIPSNFDFEKIKRKFPPQDGYVPVDYKVYIFLASIVEKHNYQESMRERYGDYTYISYGSLEKRYSIKCLKNMRLWLREAGVIEYSNYVVGEHPFGFRFVGKYATAHLKEVAITKYTMVKKILKNVNIDLQAVLKYPVLHNSLKDLSINTDEAFRCSNKLLKKEIPTYTVKLAEYEGPHDSRKKKKPTNPWIRRNCDSLAIIGIKRGIYTFTTGKKSGRLFHNVIGMRKELRKFITWKKQNLVSLDIANSQPFLSTILFFPRFWGVNKNSNLEEKHPEMGIQGIHTKTSKQQLNINQVNKDIRIRQYKKEQPANKYVYYIMNDEMTEVIVPEDVKEYVEICLEGQLYEEMLAKSKALGGKYIHYTRADMKVAVLQSMFSDNRFIHQDGAELKRLFKKLFPSVYELFSFIKLKGKTDLAVLLQSIERKLILDVMVPRFAERYPGLPIITIHDSIATLETHKNALHAVMCEVFMEKLGYVPLLDDEVWG